MDKNRRYLSVTRAVVALDKMDPEAKRCGRRRMWELIIGQWVKWEWEDMGGGLPHQGRISSHIWKGPLAETFGTNKCR